LWWGAAVSAGYSLVYILGIHPIAQVFTDHHEVRMLVGDMILWVAVILPLNGAVFVFDGIFIGANDSRFLFGAMALSSFGVFLPGCVLFVDGLDLGLQGAWMGLNGLMLGRFATLCYRYNRDGWLRSMVRP
jgi:MATE family multidrug resistance protein